MAEIIEMPKLGFDMAEGTLVKWLKAEGEKIKKGDMLADIETDKATLQVESSASGVVFKHLVEANTTVPIASPIAVIAAEGEEVDLDKLLGETAQPAANKPAPQEEQPGPSAPAPANTTTSGSAKPESGFIKASPVAKAMAAEKAVNLAAPQRQRPGRAYCQTRRGSRAPVGYWRPNHARQPGGRHESAHTSANHPRTGYTRSDQPFARCHWQAHAGIEPEYPALLPHPQL